MPVLPTLPYQGGRFVRSSQVRFALPLLVLITLLVLTSFAGGQGVAVSESAVPERYATTSLSTDYPGGDYQSIFDISLVRCHAACLADGDCVGFTFDQRNNACFLKDAIGDPVYTLDAIGGVIKSKSEAELAQAREVTTAMSFLSADLFDGAGEQARTMAESYAAGEFSGAEWLAAAQRRLEAGEVAEAVSSSGAAITVADSGAAWLLHARALSELAAQDSNRAFGPNQRSAYAALNAALRLPLAERTDALLVLAAALERIYRGSEALATMQYADRLVPGIDPDELVRLHEAFGFRVLSNDVDARSAAPRICVFFSEDLATATNYDQFVQRSTPGLAIEVDGAQLCLAGVLYGESYSLTLRQGLPSASGETLARSVPLEIYVRDRAPSVLFPGRAYVLPAQGPRALPVETVNADHLELRLLRVADRNVVATIRDGTFVQALGAWEGERFEELLTEVMWTGEAFLDGELNLSTPSLLPLDEVGELEPGVYVLRAAVFGADTYDVPPATQWFLVSDLGVTSLAGADGLHAVVQRLSDGQPAEGLSVQLVARSNRVLGEETTDAQGHVVFPAALSHGSGNSAPAMLLVEGDDDLVVLSLEEPEFDLSDRGVEGRVPPGPIDIFLTPDRGAYRPGESINLTILARDAQAQAIAGLPLSVRLLRPDGVEYTKVMAGDGQAGGYVVSLPLGPGVPRGPWRVEVFVDPDAPALATRSVLVEDFLPERVDFEPTLSAFGPIDLSAPPTLELEARYLFGAPAAGLTLSGEVSVSTSDSLPGWPGYRFGRHDQRVDTQLRTFPPGLQTGPDGHLAASLPLDRLTLEPRPYQVEVLATLIDGASRPVERSITRALRPPSAVVGIRPAFDGALDENSEAGFDMVLVDPSGEALAGELQWQVDRVETRYQWYAVDGRWYWEPVTERQRIGDGTVTTQGEPVRLEVPVTWGRYELRVTRSDAGAADGSAPSGAPASAPTSASVPFTAGWAAADTSRETPDLLELSLDADEYRPGDTARLRLVPESSGVALISVLSNRVVDLQLVAVEGETTIELPVTEEWGTGVYVTASLIRPSDGPAQLPSRSLGLAHAAVAPGERVLKAVLDVPEQVRSGDSLEVVLEVPGALGERVFATIAAVDLGVLNLTAFEAPDPTGHYFGQRALGVAIRDLYGRLIDARQGAIGEIRSGADAAEFMEAGPAPAEDLLALFSGPLELVDGRAEVTFDLPPFDGTVRLMAVVWSEEAVGQASADVIARDPVVLQASLPRFMTPGDESRLRLEVTHVDGPAGTMRLQAEGHGLGEAPETVDLSQGGRAVIDLPLRPTVTGEHVFHLTLTTPDDVVIERQVRLSVQHTDPVVARSTRLSLAPGETFLLDDTALAGTALAGFLPGTTSLTLAAGPGAALDLPGLILRLLDYPYTCTEQVASGLQPLLYAPAAVERLGLLSESEIDEAVQERVDRILTRQGRNGSFGLWAAGGFDLWLDAYSTDVLLSAEAAGAQVPATALRQALDNLRNEVAMAGQMNDGAPAYAYAFYVLARAGEAAIGDLRYYVDALPERFDTPLAAAHMAAALAAYGERGRAETMFARASQLALEENDEGGWRDDYGTVLRDRAALLALAAESDSAVVDRERLTGLLVRDGPVDRLSPQEAAWLLRAAVALSESASGRLSLGGESVSGDVVYRYDGEPTELRNDGDEVVNVTLTAFGVPSEAPAASGNGYAISRSFYTPAGEAADLDDVSVGDRLVVVLEVTPQPGVPGGRLMIDDALPAGLEIDNANLLRSGDVRGLEWLTLTANAEASEARAERFLAAVNWTSEEPLRLAYIVRAVSDGTFHYPAPLVEDLYRPTLRAIGETGSLTVRR